MMTRTVISTVFKTVSALVGGAIARRRGLATKPTEMGAGLKTGAAIGTKGTVARLLGHRHGSFAVPVEEYARRDRARCMRKTELRARSARHDACSTSSRAAHRSCKHRESS